MHSAAIFLRSLLLCVETYNQIRGVKGSFMLVVFRSKGIEKHRKHILFRHNKNKRNWEKEIVASQYKVPGSNPCCPVGTFLCFWVCTFSPCLCWYCLGTSASSHSPEAWILGWLVILNWPQDRLWVCTAVFSSYLSVFGFCDGLATSPGCTPPLTL